jgi:hypothetical protein
MRKKGFRQQITFDLDRKGHNGCVEHLPGSTEEGDTGKRNVKGFQRISVLRQLKGL